MSVFDKVVEILSDHTDIPAEKITMESSFEELSLDSLDIVDLVMTMEDTFSITIEMDDQIKTVGALVDMIEKLKKN